MRKKLIFIFVLILCVSLFFGCSSFEASVLPVQTSSQSIVTQAQEYNEQTTPSTDITTEDSSSSIAQVSGELKAHFIDVGQGDSEFIEFPDGECMLIDAGGNEYGDEIVDYIQNLGYSKIDYLVATHPHADHIGGMAFVVNSFNIGTIYMPKVSTDTKTFENLLEAIQDKGLTIKSAKSGIVIKDGVTILSPTQDSYQDLNDFSVVIRMIYGETTFLFMGDASKNVESDITEDISTDVLKVGHHGSETASSQEFIKKVSPQIAIISAGVNNDYGHPHQVTLDTLNAAGVKIFGTYDSGTISVTSDGKAYMVDKDPVYVAEATSEAVRTEKPETVQPEASATTEQEYVGSINSNKYHYPWCQWAEKIHSENEIWFSSEEDAKVHGYVPCKVCNP